MRILTSVTAAVLGTPALDMALFRSRINSVEVHEGNRLVFNFRDGHAVTTIWKDHSRKWSEEAKEAARVRQRQYEASREVSPCKPASL